MPPKTLYVKDQQLWEKAKTLAGHQAFSGVIMRLLAKWVADKEKHEAMKSGKEFTKIELWVGGDEHHRWYPKDLIGRDYKVAFTGRLLDSTEVRQYAKSESGRLYTSRPRAISPAVDVYEMSDGRLAVNRDFDDSKAGATCLVYSDFQNLRDNPSALDTIWEDPHEQDVTEMLEVPPFIADTAEIPRELGITDLAGLREILKGQPLTMDIDSWIYENVQRKAYELHFLKGISDALGAELIVRI